MGTCVLDCLSPFMTATGVGADSKKTIGSHGALFHAELIPGIILFPPQLLYFPVSFSCVYNSRYLAPSYAGTQMSI